MLSVYLLGERRLLDGPHDISASIQYRKAWALLGYLAVEAGRKHSREYLAELLWPALAPAAARTNLRQVIANLNRVFAAHGASALFQASREEVGLYPQAGVAIDVHRLERASGLAEGPELLALEDWAAGFSSEFLGGLLLDDCPEFEDWLQPTRARLGSAATRTLRRLLDAQQSAGLDRQAIVTARRLSMLNPWDEACLRQLMTVLAADGQYEEALTTFEQLRSNVLAELGSSPSLPTVALRDAIQAALDGVATGLSVAGLASRPSTRHWMCGIVCRVQSAHGTTVETLLADVGRHLQAAGARILFASRDTAYACVVADGLPGDLNAAAVRTARIACATLDAFRGSVAVALCPGIVRAEPYGSVVMLGNTGEWASHLLAHARTDQTILCESLFETLFETFALHPHAEVVLPEITRPVRVWRLGVEGASTPQHVATHALGDMAQTVAGPLMPDAVRRQGSEAELLTLRIGQGNASMEDGVATTAWLTVVEGADRGKRAGIAEQLLIVGRASDSDLQLPRRTVSRHHCVVWRDAEHYRIRDLGATNRTRVNGEVVRERRLNDGDTVSIGECILKFDRAV